VTLRELGEGLREGFGEGDLLWLLGVVGSLEKDGLAVVSSAGERPRAVAEERAAYDGADRREDPPCATTRVSLP
jgi:hypothetical protein